METLEGIIVHTPLNKGTPEAIDANAVRSYALTHREGRVDVAWTIGSVQERRPGEQVSFVYPDSFEKGVLGSAPSTAAKMRELGVDGPWVVFATIVGIKGFQLVINREYASDPAWRDQTTLPELVVDHINEASLLPIFKSFWLLFGVPRPADRTIG